MNARKAIDTRRSVMIAILLSALLATTFGAAGCGEQMARMQDNQVKLQAMVAANSRELATLSSQVHVSQSEIEKGFAQLDGSIQNADARIAAVQSEQAQLRQTVVANDQNLNEKVAQLADNQASLRDGISHVADITQRTNATINTVAKDQATLHQLVRNMKNEMGDSLTAVASNQQQTHAGIDRLHQADRDLVDLIAAVTAKQDALQRLTQNHNEQLVGHLTTLSSDQGQLRNDVGDLRSLTQTVATDVTTIGNEQTTLHDTVTNNTAALAEKIAVVWANQSSLQSVIDRVADTADATASDITAMSQAQTTMQQAQASRHEALTGQLHSVVQNQDHLRAGINGLDEKATASHDRLTALASGQGAIQDTLRTNNDAVTAGLTSLANNHQDINNNVSALGERSDRLLTDLAAVAAEQTALQRVVSNSNENLASVAEGQTVLQRSVSNLDDKTTTVATDISSMSRRLTAVDESLKTNGETVVARLTALADNQQGLQAGINQVDERTSQVAAEQATMHQAIRSHNDASQGRMTELADNQRMIQTGLNTMTATTNQSALTVLAMGNRQSEMEQAMQSGIAGLAEQTQQLASGQQTLNEALRDRSDSLGGQMVALSQKQEQIQSGLDSLATTTSQVAAGVASVNDHQTDQSQAMQANQQQLVARLDATADAQQQIREGLDTVTATTTQTALDVLTVNDVQSRQLALAQANQQQLVARLDATVQGQQQINEGLDTITATTTQTALDVLTVNDNQIGQAQAAQANQQQLIARLDTTVQGQQQIKGALDSVAATTTQTALDVLTGNDSQVQQSRTLQAGQQTIVSELSTVAQDQQKVRAGLEAVAATTTQVAEDVVTVGDNQVKLEQAVEANRHELVTKLAEIAQGQQQWLTRFDAAQANIETMATSITSLEQRVAKLQGTLQNSLSDLTTLLDAKQQQRAQFEETVRSDVQFMGDSLVQLKDAHSGLEKQIQKMQSSSETRNEALLSAIEQLQRKADSGTAAAPVEMKSSKAQPKEIILP